MSVYIQSFEKLTQPGIQIYSKKNILIMGLSLEEFKLVKR